MTRGWVCAMHSIDYAPLPGHPSQRRPAHDSVRGRLFRSGIVANETKEENVVEVTYLLQIDFGGMVPLDIRRQIMALRLHSLRFLNDHFRNSHDKERVRSVSSTPPVLLPVRPTSATVGTDPSSLPQSNHLSNPNGQGGRFCMGCGSKFHLLQRKYHCQACGEIFCSHCSIHQRMAPGLGGDKFSLCHACASRDVPSKNGGMHAKRNLLMLENGRRSTASLPAPGTNSNAPPASASLDRMRPVGASYVVSPQDKPSFRRGQSSPQLPSRTDENARYVAPLPQDDASFMRSRSPPSYDSGESFYLGATPPQVHDRSNNPIHRQPSRSHHHHSYLPTTPDDLATSPAEGTVVNLGDIGNAADALAALAVGQPVHANRLPVVPPAPDSPVARGPSPRASSSFLENEADILESLVDNSSEWRGQVEPIRRPRRGSAVVDLRDIKNASELLQKLDNAEAAGSSKAPPFQLPTPHSSRPLLAQLANHPANPDPVPRECDDDHNDAMPPSQRKIVSAASLPSLHANEDAVTFQTFAPPCVSREAMFDLTLWAYVVHNDSGQNMTKPPNDSETPPCYVPLRRGAVVHATMAGPDGFNIAAAQDFDPSNMDKSSSTSSKATATFTWVGDSTKVVFHVQGRGSHDLLKLGQAVFTVTIAVGTRVVVVRSYIHVTSNRGESFQVAELRQEADAVPVVRRHIPFHDLRLGTLASHSPTGLSYRARWRDQDVVVRLVPAPTQPSEARNNADNDQLATAAGAVFQRHAAILTVLGYHPHIDSVLGASTDLGEPWAIVSECTPLERKLDDLLHQNHHYSSLNSPSLFLAVHDKVRILCDIALGLLNVHEAGFVVRDVTAPHCVVHTLTRRAKLVDLDIFAPFSAAPHHGAFERETNMAALKYFAPESLQPPHEFSFKSDVYSFGVLMWETFKEARPFGNLTAAEAAAWVVEGGRLDHISDIPVDHRDLLVQCFQEVPSKRPSAADIVAHFRAGLVSTTNCALPTTSSAKSTERVGSETCP
ncbi:hypothetical protein DYB32_007144 [Aphanomyces invadans]|uniref:TKL protein kinase n=1 Tax=Aphanomyces invadans TaxID=157072 RepID=A0A418APS3_9STRA|nr:hypothetical protein DYB32_007144 [Aphanomyces invadans]